MRKSRKRINDLITRRKRELNQGKTFPKVHFRPRYKPIAFKHIHWLVIGASVTGNGHKTQNIPCQDNHKTQIWNNGWGVAVVSDGAGSATHSHLASAFLVEEAVKQALYLVRRKKWMEQNILPTMHEWDMEGKALILNIHEALIFFAEKKGIPLADLHATLILTIFSGKGLLTAHIGDGRAGYRDQQGNYHSLITPFDGEQAGQTVFITMDLQKRPDIIGTQQVKTSADALFLLTDGCERVSWETVQKNDATGKFEKINKPFEPFFNQTIQAFRQMHKTHSTEAIQQTWQAYLDNGHKGFVSETDDKTMVVVLREG
jgi:hypothetical protein